MFEITTEVSFSAAHKLKNYNGPCENLHGHNWLVRATVRCESLNDIGIGIDFKELRKNLAAVVADLDHTDLNAVFEARGENPSSENVAKLVYQALGKRLAYANCEIHRVEVFETPGNGAAYLEHA